MDDSINQLINKGWEQMNKSLDKEMPVRHPYISIKNKFIYSIAVVFFFLPITYIFFNNGHFWSRNSNPAFTFINGPKNSEIANKKSKNRDYVKLKFVNSPEPVENKIVYKDLNESERRIGNVAEKINPSSVGLFSNKEKPEIRGNKINFEKIEASDLQSLNIDYPLIKKNKQNNLSFYFNSVNKDFVSLAGLDGALSFTYAITEKLGFCTGIEHTLLTEEINIDEKKFIYNYYNIDLNYGSKDYIFVKPGFVKNKMYYLGIPVSLLYRVNNVAFSAGFKVSYLLIEKYPEIPDFGENFEEFRIVAFENPKFKNVKDNFDYSMVFRLEFKVKDNISVFSKFNYSLKDVFNSQGKPKYNPYYPVAQSKSIIPDDNSKDYYFGFGIKYDVITR